MVESDTNRYSPYPKEVIRQGMVSIVVRTRNEADTIGRTLEGVKLQIAEPLEILLVDNGSTDGTVEIAERFGCRVIKIDNKYPYNHARACNIGVDEARGDIVVITVGHAYPASNSWLETASHHFADEKVAGLTGNVQVDGRGSIWEVIRTKFLLNMATGTGVRRHTKNSLLGNRDLLNGVNSALRKELWRQRPFDEEFSGKFNGGEDKEWALYFIKQEYVFIYDPAFSVYHCHGDNFDKMIKRNFGYMLMYLGAYLRYKHINRTQKL